MQRQRRALLRQHDQLGAPRGPRMGVRRVRLGVRHAEFDSQDPQDVRVPHGGQALDLRLDLLELLAALGGDVVGRVEGDDVEVEREGRG